MSDIFVDSFTHLKDKPHANKALELLKRVASLVKPIMRKHGWILPVLAEFFPDDPNLLGLNVNMGQKILVRLRPAHSPDSFFPEEDVIGTLLHELTHNVHGPHDEKFYKYLDGLQDEYDALQRSGYAGEGFFSEGKRLGVNVSHNVPPHLARLKALEAAEKRIKVSRVLGSGGRLGGRRVIAGLSPRELAARAAEQRARDEKSCASGADAQHEAEKAAKESTESKVIDLTLEDSDEENHPADPKINNDHFGRNGPKTVPLKKPKLTPKSNFLPNTATTSGALPKSPQIKSKGTSEFLARQTQIQLAAEWPCPTCTLLNPVHLFLCDACQTAKPIDVEGWTCWACGEVGNLHDHWSCKF